MEHIIISGTGRAGTTFLVQYLTAAGFDTGYDLDEAISQPRDVLSRAGLERRFTDPDLPQVIKSPWFSDMIGQVLAAGTPSILAAIIPVRDLAQAAESRRHVHRAAEAQGADPRTYPGALWKTQDPAEQESRLAVQFHNLVEPLVRFGVPIYFLPFPSFATNHEVLYQGLKPLLDRQGVSREMSETAFRRTSQPSLIHHRFGPDAVTGADTAPPQEAAFHFRTDYPTEGLSYLPAGTVELRGWGVARGGGTLSLLAEIDGTIRTFPMNIHRPDVVAKVLGQDPATSSRTRCGFRYTLLVTQSLRLGVEMGGERHWVSHWPVF